MEAVDLYPVINSRVAENDLKTMENVGKKKNKYQREDFKKKQKKPKPFFTEKVHNYLTTRTVKMVQKLCSMAFCVELFKYIWYSEEKSSRHSA